MALPPVLEEFVAVGLVGLDAPLSPVSTLMSLCFGDTYLTSGEGEDGDWAVEAGGAEGTTEEFAEEEEVVVAPGGVVVVVV